MAGGRFPALSARAMSRYPASRTELLFLITRRWLPALLAGQRASAGRQGPGSRSWATHGGIGWFNICHGI